MMVNIGDSGSRLHALQDPVVFAAVKDWLQVVAPHLVLIDCIEAIKTALSSGHPVVALDCKRCSRQHLTMESMPTRRHTIHLCAGCGHKWDVTPQVQGNPLAALRC